MQIIQAWIGDDVIPDFLLNCMESTKKIFKDIPYHFEKIYSDKSYAENLFQSDIYRIEKLKEMPDAMWVDLDVEWTSKPKFNEIGPYCGSVCNSTPDSYLIYPNGDREWIEKMLIEANKIIGSSKSPKNRIQVLHRIYRPLYSANRIDRGCYIHHYFNKIQKKFKNY